METKGDSVMLNLSNARAYVLSIEPSARIIEPRGFEYLGNCEGTPTISLQFTLDHDSVDIFKMDMWLESGQIYGEY